MQTGTPIHRRTLLADLGRGAFALAVVSIAGCAPTASASPGTSAVASPGSSTPPTPPPSVGGDGAFTWERVDLGFVSAYILSRGGEAAIVDTGVGGSADAIEASLTGIGLDWSAVGHLILTHRHGDHVGSAADILERAPDATGYAGAADAVTIAVPRQLVAVEDGDDVFGLTIVTTPGHTPGSISVFDQVGGLLIAGDAIGTEAGAPTLPGAEFTEDMDLARESIVKIGGLAFETLLVGHGDPIEGGAAALVAELGASSQSGTAFVARRSRMRSLVAS